MEYLQSIFLVFWLTIISVCSQDPCPPCKLSECPTISCASGETFPETSCPCCPVCALNVGESCYDAKYAGLQHPGVVIPCGGNTDCKLRNDLMSDATPEAQCTCQREGRVCGSNNRTYETVCHLRKEPETLIVISWGPCKSAPEIWSPPEDTYGILHKSMAMGCEAKGNPVPDIYWSFHGQNRRVEKLPADDMNLSIQIRGGPEVSMITSWVQILEFRPMDSGTYTCIATNSKGTAEASAIIRIKQKVSRLGPLRHNKRSLPYL